MADTYSSLLRLRLQQTGSNNNTWGGLLNSAALQLIEDALSGRASIAVTGSDITLSTANGANDQARYAVLALSGAPGAPRNIICPSSSKLYLVVNSTDAAMTVKTSAGTGVAVPVGVAQYVYCDGTNVIEVKAGATGAVATATNALQLGGVVAANYARLDAANSFTKGLRNTFLEVADGATVTFDCALAKNFHVTLGGNRTAALTNPTDGQEVELWIQQDAGGSRTLAWPGIVSFEGGVTPTLSTAATAIDRFIGTYYAATTKWIFRPGQNVGAGSSTTVSITQSGDNLKLHDLAGRPGGVVNLAITINYGVVIGSRSPRVAALDLTGFAGGSTLTITNNGRIMARGGRAGRGGAVFSAGDDFMSPATPGEQGGNAILGPGAGITCTINNANGYIWGGGGGGGGGGVTTANGTGCAGGGGGGGAPFGSGGDPGGGGSGSNTSVGGIGASAITDTGGAGGGGGTSTGSGTGGAGGTGGAPGTAGANGASPVGQAFTISGAAGGAVGKAIEFNGGSVSVPTGATAPNVYGAVS